MNEGRNFTDLLLTGRACRGPVRHNGVYATFPLWAATCRHQAHIESDGLAVSRTGVNFVGNPVGLGPPNAGDGNAHVMCRVVARIADHQCAGGPQVEVRLEVDQGVSNGLCKR